MEANEMMVEATAKATYLRIAPRKVQIVLDLIRNKPTDEALAILKHTPKAACEPLEKLLKSAIANAENKNKPNQRSLDQGLTVFCSSFYFEAASTQGCTPLP